MRACVCVCGGGGDKGGVIHLTTGPYAFLARLKKSPKPSEVLHQGKGCQVKSIQAPSAAVRSKAWFPLLCHFTLFIVALILCGVGPCFVVQYVVSFQFCNHLAGEERAGCFTLIVFFRSCGC